MNRPTMLHEQILHNVSICINVAVKRDIEVIRHRFGHEGMSFLTITLPSLCDGLDQALALGRLTASMFQGFKPWRRHGNLPAFMVGFFKRVFQEDGSLLADPCIDSIRAIRQVARFQKKVELPCSAARREAAFERYRTNDESIDSTASFDSLVGIIASYLWSDLEILSERFYCSPGIFGSGATAEKYGFNERHTIKEWPERGEHCFPLAYHGSHFEGDEDSFAGIRILDERAERPVRVVQVPKTLKTPRTISVEPSYMMLRQQSIAKILMDYLEGDGFPFKSIRFTDQTVNNSMAREGSLDGSLATIDLSDASDLVSNNLVSFIFKSCPTFHEYIDSCRTRVAQMPDGSFINLKKFASMGSAMCFPIEAMVFFTITLSAMVHHSGKRPSHNLLRRLAAKTAVYGDDIIIPTETADTVIEWLEAHGLRVNQNKSFTTGFFRESCGGDYYKGADITPVYSRQLDTGVNTRDPDILLASVSLSNQFYMKGMWHVSQYMRDHVEKVLRRTLPRSRIPIGGLSWASYLYDTKLRWDANRCSWRVKSLKAIPRRTTDEPGSVRGAMLRAFGNQHLSEFRKDLNVRTKSADQTRKLFAESIAWTDAASVTYALTQRGLGTGSIGSRFLVRDDVSPVSGHSTELSWEDTKGRNILDVTQLDHVDRLSTSIRPYSLNMKSRWIPVQTGNWA